MSEQFLPLRVRAGGGEAPSERFAGPVQGVPPWLSASLWEWVEGALGLVGDVREQARRFEVTHRVVLPAMGSLDYHVARFRTAWQEAALVSPAAGEDREGWLRLEILDFTLSAVGESDGDVGFETVPLALSVGSESANGTETGAERCRSRSRSPVGAGSVTPLTLDTDVTVLL